MTKKGKSLCKECKYRFRRVFIPSKSEEYEDEDGNIITADGPTAASLFADRIVEALK